MTDHAALKWLKNIKKPSSRLFKWSLKLSQYSFEIRYNPGSNNVEADTLSRYPVLENFHNTEYLKLVNLVEIRDIVDSQREYFKEHSIKNLRYEDGVAYRNKSGFRQVYVPPDLRQQILDEFHRQFGHIGVKQMLLMISKKYFWENMTASVKKKVDECQICSTNKTKREKELGELSITGPATYPLEIVSLDTIGGFEGYNSKFRYIHCVIDHFSRFIWTRASKTQRASDYVSIMKEILNIHFPKMVLTDRYAGIRSREFENFLSLHDVQVKYISTQCPQSNGIIERVNQTLINKLRCLYNDQVKTPSWDKLLPTATKMYNETIHSSTGYSPKYLLFGVGEDSNLLEARTRAFQKSQEIHNYNKKKIR